MSEKRGSRLLKIVDLYVGNLMLLAICILFFLKNTFPFTKNQNSSSNIENELHTQTLQSEKCLLLCFGAIGDLILLTQAAKASLNGKQIYLACSSSNIACAQLYQDFYAKIEPVNLRSLNSISKLCNEHSIDVIYDSTQWANIGPILSGIARLLNVKVTTIGFMTSSHLRNISYSKVVNHSPSLHEIGNFINLLLQDRAVRANSDLTEFLPTLCTQKKIKKTKKILFHMWPSGSRSYLKEWPQKYWSELAKYCLGHGYEIYLSGSPADFKRNQDLIEDSGLPLINIAGTYDLIGLKDFITRNVEFAISVNTGILHLVSSLEIPVIGLHGPTNPSRWGPLSRFSQSLLPRSGQFAYLNYGFEYPKEDAIAYSLDRLEVSQVIEAFEGIKNSQSI